MSLGGFDLQWAGQGYRGSARQEGGAHGHRPAHWDYHRIPAGRLA
jgi:hypothetical protein